MQRLNWTFGFAACALIAAAPAARAVTADEIIAQHVAALGGAEKLKAIRTLRRSGHLYLPGFNAELACAETRARPAAIRQEVTLQGLTQVEAYDGKDAWAIRPFQGRKDPVRMSADEAKSLRLEADIDQPLVDYRAKGHTVEYLGMEDVDGTPAHKLRVRLAWGDDVIYWIDPDSWMVVRDLQRQTVRGSEQVTESDYGEYERVAGVWIAMSVETGARNADSSAKMKYVFDKAEANVAAEPGTFAYPGGRPAGESRP
jgi:hypothetical protein